MKKFVEIFFQLQAHGPLQLQRVEWQEGLTISDVVHGLSHVELRERPVGIYGKLVDASHVVQAGERIEIYAPLQIDPKEARRLRVIKKKR
ncbi:MAG: RnfH family protein [Gammaproteobacteria bacterium]|jgi:putative ubiquitin-RnfH superfamily antitoxin RatB of RatAB toxin-antitoxin module|nr:RnfH family protein [Gammaproteobacteria bacterium]